MQVLSLSNTIVATASARVFKTGPAIADDATLYHEPGVVLELPDDEALRMIERGLVERYVRAVHGEDPIAAARARAQAALPKVIGAPSSAS